jgi:glycosyltransferase involved in cell wall biosynthesis
MTGVTVAICCYNSANRIRKTLEHLLIQIGVSCLWEVVLVDNCSTDNTAAVAEETWTSTVVPLRIVRESEPGQMYARQCAFREAAYEYVTFVDDDNWVCAQWVSEVARIMEANPQIAALGTRSEPVFEVTPPPWFKQFQGCYAAGQQWPEVGDVTETRGFLWGAGLTIRKTAWEKITSLGFHSQLQGRQGSALSGGDDNEICQALRLAGWRLYHEPRLSFKHFIPTTRLEWNYLRKIVTGFGASSILLDVYKWSYSNSKPPWHYQFSCYWMYPAISAIKALLKRPLATANILCGRGLGHPSAYYVYFHHGRLQSAWLMRSKYYTVFQSISKCAKSLQHLTNNDHP